MCCLNTNILLTTLGLRDIIITNKYQLYRTVKVYSHYRAKKLKGISKALQTLQTQFIYYYFNRVSYLTLRYSAMQGSRFSDKRRVLVISSPVQYWKDVSIRVQSCLAASIRVWSYLMVYACLIQYIRVQSCLIVSSLIQSCLVVTNRVQSRLVLSSLI